MKNPLTLLLLLLATAGSVVAQTRVLRQSVDDSGRRLVVEIDLERNGQPERFRGKFDVSRMDRRQKERLLGHLLDSLSLPRDVQRVALLDRENAGENTDLAEARDGTVAAQPPKPARERATHHAEARAYASAASAPAVSPSAAAPESLVPDSRPVPYSRSIDDNPATGTLTMRYVYRREGDERVYERTVDVRGKSQREKKRLAEETERLWNLSLTNQPL